ncbi:unnamed protein product [Miscanthus lutarioriparius]|uniref:Uncharacterized protein n=1 Tax=Miscanthus lutarioriparius TaxID=422564 RepID=A0A811SG57_9POAL|nr:unnamed protein product [Miscanthus lutarioriparius]
MPPQLRSPQERRPSPPPPTGGMYYSNDMEAFYDAWVGREEQIVADLTAALALPPRRWSDALAPLVDTAVAHVAAYYEHKSWLADHDVVAALAQPARAHLPVGLGMEARAHVPLRGD